MQLFVCMEIQLFQNVALKDMLLLYMPEYNSHNLEIFFVVAANMWLLVRVSGGNVFVCVCV